MTKFKARICVRGDLQQPSKEDNSQLRSNTDRKNTSSLFVGLLLQPAFDLEATQFDAINVFLHSHSSFLFFVIGRKFCNTVFSGIAIYGTSPVSGITCTSNSV